MRSWNSALKGVAFLRARSTHSSPRTLRRVFMPFSRASRVIVVPCSSEIGSELFEQLFHCPPIGSDRGARGAVRLEIRRHASGIDHEGACDRVEKVEAR